MINAISKLFQLFQPVVPRDVQIVKDIIRDIKENPSDYTHHPSAVLFTSKVKGLSIEGIMRQERWVRGTCYHLKICVKVGGESLHVHDDDLYWELDKIHTKLVDGYQRVKREGIMDIVEKELAQ